MPNAYLGIPGNVVFSSPGTVTGATNANPIVVTVSGSIPPQMQTGAVVDIQGVAGNTAANGVNVATVLSANTFSIPVAGNGAYTSGGSVNYPFSAAYNQPSDGDPFAAAAFNVPYGALGDRTAFNTLNTGAFKLVALETLTLQNDAAAQWGSQAPTAVSTWTPFSAALGLTLDTVAGDVVIARFSSTMQAANGTGVTLQLAGLIFSLTVPGGSFSSYSELPGSGVYLNNVLNPTSGGGNITPVTMQGTFTALFNLQMKIVPGVYQTGATDGGIQGYGSYYFEVAQWRPTGVPQ